MTPDEKKRAQRLFEILLGKSGRTESLKDLMDAAQSFEAFRVLLVRSHRDHTDLTAVFEDWRRGVERYETEFDEREMLHDLELLFLKQREIEKLLKANEAALLEKLHAVDASAVQLSDLSSKIRETRVAIGEYRHRVKLLAGTKGIEEKGNGVARASG